MLSNDPNIDIMENHGVSWLNAILKSKKNNFFPTKGKKILSV